MSILAQRPASGLSARAGGEAAAARPRARTATEHFLRGDRYDTRALQGRLGVVDAGLVALVRQQADRRLAIEVYGAGSLIGERSLLGDPSLPGHRVDVLLPSRIRWFEAPIAADATATSLALAIVAARTRLQMSVSCQKRWQSIPQQIGQWLIELSDCSADGSSSNGAPYLTHEALATLVGTPRTAVSHVMAQLTRRGLIRRPTAGSIVLDLTALEAFTRGEVVADLIPHREQLRRSEATLATYLGLAEPDPTAQH